MGDLYGLLQTDIGETEIGKVLCEKRHGIREPHRLRKSDRSAEVATYD